MNLANRGPMGLKAGKERFTPRERRYFKWLHTWNMGQGMCCLTGRLDIELAHTSTVAEGKGMSIKGPLRHVLSIARPLHHFEERFRDTFWSDAGFPGKTRFHWSERLLDIFEAGEDPMALFMDMQARADRAFLAQILGAAA